MVAYLGTVQTRPCEWVPDVVVIFLCIASITSNIYRPFEEWIKIFMKLFLSFFVNYDHVTERTQARLFEDES